MRVLLINYKCYKWVVMHTRLMQFYICGPAGHALIVKSLGSY